MPDTTISFEQAYKRLQEIHTLLQSDSFVDVEQLIALQKEAKDCYELCEQLLKRVEQQ